MHLLNLIITIVFFVVLAGTTKATESAGVFEVRVWAGANAKADPRVVKIVKHHACTGEVAVIRVDHMPPPRRKVTLEPELVVELSQTGKIIRRWPMPVDSIVAAVSGGQIIIPRGDARAGAEALAINERGDLSLRTIPASADFGKSIKCPLIREFGDSAYLRCFEHRDLASGQIRRIAYQGPCT
jgi:hypothetical protein